LNCKEKKLGQEGRECWARDGTGVKIQMSTGGKGTDGFQEEVKQHSQGCSYT